MCEDDEVAVSGDAVENPAGPLQSHGATVDSSTRDRTAINRSRKTVGAYPAATRDETINKSFFDRLDENENRRKIPNPSTDDVESV